MSLFSNDNSTRVSVGFNKETKIYDVDGNILNINDLTNLPIKFIPTMEIRKCSDTGKFTVLMTKATITHIGTVREDISDSQISSY